MSRTLQQVPIGVCPNACSEPYQAEITLAEAGISGAFLGSFLESSGAVALPPDAKFNEISLLLLADAAKRLARKLGYGADNQSGIAAFMRILPLLQSLEEKPLDIVACSYMALLDQGKISLCPGRCGRRSMGGKRWRESVDQVLRSLLQQGSLRVTALMRGVMRFEVMVAERVTSTVELSSTLLTAEPELLEIAWRMMLLTHLAGFRLMRTDKIAAPLVSAMMAEAQQRAPFQIDAAKVVDLSRRKVKRLNFPGLVIDGEVRAWAGLYNQLLADRLQCLGAYYSETVQ